MKVRARLREQKQKADAELKQLHAKVKDLEAAALTA